MTGTSRKVTYIGLYSALCTVIGLLFAPIPNIELILLFIFFGGYFFGALYGIVIGGTASFLWSSLNPWGSGLAFPPLLTAQIIGMSVAGLAGGLIRNFLPGLSPGSLRTGILGLCGAAITIQYHLILSIFTFKFAGFSDTQFQIAVASGLTFALWHIISNALIFPVFMPILIRVSRHFPISEPPDI
ncbi:ECF transporter S component [candidate division KSB1 bacterium]